MSAREFRKDQEPTWITVGRPGYFGKNKDDQLGQWDKEYGQGNWRLAWQLRNGTVLQWDQIYELYVQSYTAYFLKHLDEATFITDNYFYAYDKTLKNKEEAFDQYAYFDKPGKRNEFHDVAFNHALSRLGFVFKGTEPLQVREGKPGTPQESWPKGWQWSPGRIPAIDPNLIPNVILESSWWQPGSIEELYQKSKVLQIKQ